MPRTSSSSGTLRALGDLRALSDDVSVAPGGTFECTGSLCTLDIDGAGHLNVEGEIFGSTVDIDTGSADITGLISSNGRGEAAASGTGAGIACMDQGSSGASHGGLGRGCGSAPSYGSATEPWTYGSGGGNQAQYGTTGGAGGGRVRLNATGDVHLAGVISSDGAGGEASTSKYGGGGGSGGSVQLLGATISGDGTLSAQGGAGGFVTAGGGGGGRIAIYAASGAESIVTRTEPGVRPPAAAAEQPRRRWDDLLGYHEDADRRRGSQGQHPRHASDRRGLRQRDHQGEGRLSTDIPVSVSETLHVASLWLPRGPKRHPPVHHRPRALD